LVWRADYALHNLFEADALIARLPPVTNGRDSGGIVDASAMHSRAVTGTYAARQLPIMKATADSPSLSLTRSGSGATATARSF
jgi:hypothetical protein